MRCCSCFAATFAPRRATSIASHPAPPPTSRNTSGRADAGCKRRRRHRRALERMRRHSLTVNHPPGRHTSVELTPQFIAGLRDRMADKHGRRIANYVMAVISVACEHGNEQGIIKENPVRGVKRVRRARGAPAANRPWTETERQVVLTQGPPQIRIPVALGMFTGLRKGDVLKLTKSAIRNGQIWRRTSKTGQEVSIPIHPDVAQLLAAEPAHDAVTIAVTTNGTPWTISGFNSTFIKAIAKLQGQGVVGEGLTFHGLRHTVGRLLIEAGADIDTVRRWLGQKTLAMAIHYSETADTSERMQRLMTKLDPLGTKRRTKVSNSAEKVSNSDSDFSRK